MRRYDIDYGKAGLIPDWAAIILLVLLAAFVLYHVVKIVRSRMGTDKRGRPKRK